MAVRMRFNKDSSAHCKVCGASRFDSLEMFDVAFTDKARITMCDECMQVLADKSLKAVVHVNGKVKSSRDMAVIRKRQHGTYVKDKR